MLVCEASGDEKVMRRWGDVGSERINTGLWHLTPYRRHSVLRQTVLGREKCRAEMRERERLGETRPGRQEIQRRSTG